VIFSVSAAITCMGKMQRIYSIHGLVKFINFTSLWYRRMFYRGHMKYLREADENSSFMPPDEFKTRRQKHNLRQTQDTNTDDTNKQLNFNIKFQKKEVEDHDGVRRFKKAAHIIENVIRLEHFSSNHEKDWVLRKEAGVVFWLNTSTGEVSTIRPWETTKDGRRASRTAPAGGTRSSIIREGNSPMAASNKSLQANAGTPRAAQLAARKASMEGRLPPIHQALSGSVKPSSLWDDQSQGSLANNSEDPSADVELGTGCLVYDSSEVENLFAMLDAGK
jgi:hypothetical protein